MSSGTIGFNSERNFEQFKRKPAPEINEKTDSLGKILIYYFKY